jgi:hypothetical protein
VSTDANLERLAAKREGKRKEKIIYKPRSSGKGFLTSHGTSFYCSDARKGVLNFGQRTWERREHLQIHELVKDLPDRLQGITITMPAKLVGLVHAVSHRLR